METNLSARTTGSRAAAIVDVENLVIRAGARLPRAEGVPLLDIVRDLGRGTPTRAAAGEHVLREYMAALAGLGWGVITVPTEPDAANLALIEAGRHFIRCGVTDLVVASGDHAFVELASQARLHVVAHASHLSRRLRLAATTVTYLEPVAGISPVLRVA